jgi:hypothetical protein
MMLKTLLVETGADSLHACLRKHHNEASAGLSAATGPLEISRSWSPAGNAMDAVLDIFVFVGHAIEAVLVYVETHHWIFGFLAGGYIFYLHDRGIHTRFDALDKRLDEIRKRLAIEY